MCVKFTILVVVRFIDVVVVILLLGIVTTAIFHEEHIENAVTLTPIYFYR